MSIEFYIKDDQGTYVSEDANVRYRKLKGKALHEYLMSEEGKSKSFHVEIDEYGNKLGIEVNPEIVKKLQKEINHTEYIQRSKYEKGYEYISLVKNIGDDSVIEKETFNYDAAGNITDAPNSFFQYDTNNRVVVFDGNQVS